MGNRSDLWTLLNDREGQWVSRDNIDYIGGHDAGRRMREIRESLATSGSHRLEERKDGEGRMSTGWSRSATSEASNLRYRWWCVKCKGHPPDYGRTSATMDERWRMGYCSICRAKAIFSQQP